ncbi:hypothetical protein SALBM135S_03499 [Streptomyces alboniger]
MAVEEEPVADLGGDAESGELLQGVLLAFEAGHGVGAVGGETGVRAALLEDDLAAVAGVGARVDPAAVGEVQGLLDAVRQVGDGRRVARVELRPEEAGQGHPLGDLEGRVPRVGDEPPPVVLDGGHERALAVVAHAPCEGAVPDVQRPLLPAQVGEDVRALGPFELLVEVVQQLLELPLVGRVDRGELAAAVTARVLAVAQVQQGGGGHELEGHAAFHAVVPDGRGDAVGVREGRGDVDLPALRGHGPRASVGAERGQREPVADASGAPAVGHGAPRGLEQGGGGAALGRQPVRGLVEVPVGETVDLVPLVHASPPCATWQRDFQEADRRNSHDCHHIAVRNAWVKSRSPVFESSR